MNFIQPVLSKSRYLKKDISISYLFVTPTEGTAMTDKCFIFLPKFFLFTNLSDFFVVHKQSCSTYHSFKFLPSITGSRHTWVCRFTHSLMLA